MKNALFLIFSSFVFMGCIHLPASDDKADLYAVVEIGGPDKLPPVSKVSGLICLRICRPIWLPLLGPDGFGGRREGYEYWANLVGDGPVYKNPDVSINGLTKPTHNNGTITIDKTKKTVVINLQMIVSDSSQSKETKPSPANGVYHLKRWTK